MRQMLMILSLLLCASSLPAQSTVTGTGSISGTGTITATSGTLTPTQDWNNRCAAAGVTLCTDFSNANTYLYNGPGTGPGACWPNCYPGSTLYETTRQDVTGSLQIHPDTSTYTSGTQSMRIDCPGLSDANCSGAYVTSLSPSSLINFGPPGKSTNNDLYLQYRMKLNTEMATTDWEALVGSSPKHFDLFNNAGGSCANTEFTVVKNGNTGSAGVITAYGNCGDFGYALWNSSGTLKWDGGGGYGGSTVACDQNGGNGCLYEQGDYNCLYNTYTSPSCFLESLYANTWLTVNLHIHFVAFNSLSNTCSMQVFPFGGTLKTILNAPTQCLIESNDSTTTGFDTLFFEDYMTSKNASVSHPTASMWIDELIISTQPIANPSVAPAN